MEPVPSLLARIFATTQLININSAKVRESLQGLAIQVRHREGKPSRVFIDGKEKLGFELKTRDAAKFLSTITGALLIANTLGDTAA
jgi:hypothetical protein